MLELLRVRPLFDLSMRLGEGTGAALGMSLVEAATRLLDEMATFGEAGVSDKGNGETGERGNGDAEESCSPILPLSDSPVLP